LRYNHHSYPPPRAIMATVTVQLIIYPIREDNNKSSPVKNSKHRPTTLKKRKTVTMVVDEINNGRSLFSTS
jgi:hypothetical protein